MNIRKLGIHVVAGITTIACIGTGVKTYNKHTEQVVKNIKFELKHNPKDSIFWTRHCGANHYANEQKRIQAQIDYNAVNEPTISKIDFWKNIKFHIEKDQSMRKSLLLESRYLKKQMDAGLRQIYRYVKVGSYGKGNNIIREVKWVPKNEAERLIKEGSWKIENEILLDYK